MYKDYMRALIPNLLTLTNLFWGLIAIHFIQNGQFLFAFITILIAGVFDFADGFVARLLNVQSPLGKELDSLADMVSFGVVPGFALYHLINPLAQADLYGLNLYAIPAFIVTLFSAYRLAKFNLDERQHSDFIGLNTPAASGFIMGLLLISVYNPFDLFNSINSLWFYYSVVLIISFLLVSELPMIGFKFKNLGWADNKQRYMLIILAILAFLFLGSAAFSSIVVIYILFSIFVQIINTNKSKV